MALTIPETLRATCRGFDEREHWLGRLPGIVAELQKKWSLYIGSPVEGNDVSCSWVAPVQRNDGLGAILKIGMPHMEARDEGRGLRFWAGNPTVQLLDFAEGHNALLLERCEPGTPLRQRPESEQDTIIAGLLRRLWRLPAPTGFRHLSVMTTSWANETRAQADRWPDSGLVQEGLHLLAELSRPAAGDVLLATDLHAGNVLSAERLPWLVIDPKPFVGDPAYDATQHLLNCEARVRTAPKATIERLADLLEVDGERVRLWLFARAAAGPRRRWDNALLELASFLL